jgi:hypothetical protein
MKENFNKILLILRNSNGSLMSHRIGRTAGINNAEPILEQLCKDDLVNKTIRKSSFGQNGERAFYSLSINGFLFFEKLPMKWYESPYSFFIKQTERKKLAEKREMDRKIHYVPNMILSALIAAVVTVGLKCLLPEKRMQPQSKYQESPKKKTSPEMTKR